jgi:ribosomal protein L35
MAIMLEMDIEKAGKRTNPATITPISRKILFMPKDKSFDSRASTTLKSAVKRFKIRPKGTVSIHLNGVLRIVKHNLSNRTREARMEPVYM